MVCGECKYLNGSYCDKYKEHLTKCVAKWNKNLYESTLQCVIAEKTEKIMEYEKEVIKMETKQDKF